MEDQQIVQLYLSRDEQAISETRSKYGAYCYQIAYAILGVHGDAEELLNDTWLRVWNSVPPEKPRVLKLFLAKITRNLALNGYRDRNAQKRGGGEVALSLEELKDCVPASGDVLQNLEGQELANQIQRFLKTQSPRDRGVFLHRYFGFEPVDSIADRFGLTTANTRKILLRVREKLRNYLIKEGYTV